MTIMRNTFCRLGKFCTTRQEPWQVWNSHQIGQDIISMTENPGGSTTRLDAGQVRMQYIGTENSYSNTEFKTRDDGESIKYHI